MPGINSTRVLLGGLVAGLVLNVSEFVLNTKVVGTDMAAAMAHMNLPMVAGQQIAVFTVLCFVVGVVAVWLYAAIRPRFGPGPKTAFIAGIAVWLLADLYGGISMAVMGFFPMQLMAITLTWGLVEVLVAVQVGAYLYKE